MAHFLTQFLIQHQCGPGSSALALSRQWALAGSVLFSLKTQDNPPPQVQLTGQDDVREAQNGDPDAFRRLVERYQGHVSKLLWRFTRDKTSHEDLVQESFVQVYLSLHSYKAKAPFEHWLARIATRVGYRYWKQSKRHAHTSLQDGDWEEMSEDRADSMSSEDAGQLVHQYLAKLPPRDRLALTLRYLEQCNVEETSRRTGWSQSLVKVQTYRARQKLKKLLEKTDIQSEL